VVVMRLAGVGVRRSVSGVREERMSQTPDAKRLTPILAFTLAAALAVVVAFGLFYRFPASRLVEGGFEQPVDVAARTEQEAQSGPRIYRTGGATPDDRIGLVVVRTANPAEALAREVWEVSYAFYGVWPVVAAVIGCVLLARQRRIAAQTGTTYSANDAGDAALTVGVWLGAAAIMLVVGLVGRLYVRYPLFALPAVSLGAGVALAVLWGRGRRGQAAVIVLLSIAAAWSLLLWYDRIVYAFKPVV